MSAEGPKDLDVVVNQQDRIRHGRAAPNAKVM
jgi:hypothetical protein